MAVFSKERYQLVSDLPCQVLHPWTSSCSYNALGTFLQTVKGGSKYFMIVYLLLSKKQGLQRQGLEEYFHSFCRSCMFGGFCAGASVAVMCFFRWLCGKYISLNLGFFPGFVGGGGIFIEHPSRRETDLTLFIALVTDLWLKVLEDEGLVKMSIVKEVGIFMTCSSVLLYCLRAINDSYTVIWPFTPHKLPDDPKMRKRCPHKGDCLEDIKKTGITYLCYGIVIQSIKVTVWNFSKLFSKPSSVLRAFFKLDNLRLPLFAAIYVSLFKGVSCALCQVRGQDEAWHALPAGMVASLCYLIQPNLSLALFALSNIIQILCRELKKKLELPKWYYKEVAFMVCMGLLYHARAVYPQCFPRYMFTIMDSITDGRAEVVYDLVEKHLLIRP